ncbi:hypothetical protein TNCV_4776671 [Trichonephila clavipes]|nr:hypothetical protein TNCV_4776671 [Trichonephila clavipes]
MQKLPSHEDHHKPRLPDPIAAANSLHATKQTVKYNERQAPHQRLYDMGLKIEYLSKCPNIDCHPLLSKSFFTKYSLRYQSPFQLRYTILNKPWPICFLLASLQFKTQVSVGDAYHNVSVHVFITVQRCLSESTETEHRMDTRLF